MSTQTRLDAYLQAEAKILSGAQTWRFGDRQFQRADLAEIRRTIEALQRQLAREQAAAAGRSSLGFATVNFSGRHGGVEGA